MPITLDQDVEIKHLNIRKEGPDDEKHLMVDMKLVAKTSADILAEFSPTLRHSLFVDGEVRYPRMGEIAWSAESNHMELELVGLEILDVKLHKFKLRPFTITGQEFVDMTCTATFAPSGRDTAILADQVGETVRVVLRPGPQLDLGDDAKALKDLNANA